MRSTTRPPSPWSTASSTSSPRVSGSASLEPEPREPQAAALDLRADGMDGRNHFARHKARFVRHLVDHFPPALDRARLVDNDGDDGYATVQRQEAVAVWLPLAGVTPDTAQCGRAGRAFLAQAANELQIERVPLVAGGFCGMHHQLLPDPEPRVVSVGQMPRAGELDTVALADADAFQGDKRVGEQPPEGHENSLHLRA